jgi:hypothetical protein
VTAFVNDTLRVFLGSPSYESASTVVDVTVVVLVILVLAEHELLRAYAGARRLFRLDALTVVAAPLLVTLALVLVLRATGER